MPQRRSLTQTQLQGALSDEPLPHRTEIDEELRQLLLPRRTMGERGALLDPTKRPTVIGSPELTAAVDDIMSLVPELRDTVDRIQNPPSGAVMEEVERMAPGHFLEGLTKNRQVWVRPRTGDPMEETLIHELAHSTGTPEGRGMSNIEGLVKMRQDLRRLHGQ